MKSDDIFVPASTLESYTERQPGKAHAALRSPGDDKPKKVNGGKDRLKKRDVKQ